MRFSLLFIAVSLLFFSISAQENNRLTEEILFPRDHMDFRVSGQVPFTGEMPFFSYFIEWSGGPLPMQIRFAENADDWGPWKELKRDSHNREKGITELNIGQPEYRFFELRFNTSKTQTELAILHFYHPGETAVIDQVEDLITTNSSLACPCPQPGIQSRSEWCPAGDCMPVQPPAATDVTHLIVHHSAGTNSASDWAAIVRAIWDFHVNGNGWDDIGYNYLVDPNGVLYEGRGNDTRGAHFCGTNTNTMGVCVLGDFTNIEPSSDAIQSLERLLAWKICDINADPFTSSFHPSSGLNLMHISGHRDGCSTSCPGDSFYPLFSSLREGVNNQILANCAGLSSPINLNAAEVDPTNYFLTWSHNSEDETGFQLERSLDGGDNFELRAEIAANTLNFVEDDLELNQIYHYRIRAYNETDTSDYSNVIEINTGVVGTFEAQLSDAALDISPNPTTALLHLDLQVEEIGPVQIQVLDLTQRVLLQTEDRKSLPVWQGRVDVQLLPAGTYFLHLKLGNKSGVWRFVKQ